MRSTRHVKPLAALGAASVLAAPATIALAADDPDTARVEDASLSAPLAGHKRVSSQMREESRRLKRKRRAAQARRAARERAQARLQPSVANGTLTAIAACESGGDPSAVSADGTYRGKYQFSRETWAAMGGSGDPAAAPEAEQDRRAAALYAQAGAGQWPVCGR